MFRIGKGNFAQMYLNTQPNLVAATNAAPGSVILSWSPATGSHYLNAPAPAPHGLSIPPPTYVRTRAGALTWGWGQVGSMWIC